MDRFFKKCRILLLCFVAYPALLTADANRDSTSQDERAIGHVLSSYYFDYGVFPSGNNLDVMHALTGANPHKIVYIQMDRKYIDPKGHFLDAWGTSYRITFIGPKAVEIRSAGPDKQFGTKDDVVFLQTIDP